MRERNFDEVIVQFLLPICARMPGLYLLWVEKDSQVSLLLADKPISDANLRRSTDVGVQLKPEFVEALPEIMNTTQTQLQFSTDQVASAFL